MRCGRDADGVGAVDVRHERPAHRVGQTDPPECRHGDVPAQETGRLHRRTPRDGVRVPGGPDGGSEAGELPSVVVVWRRGRPRASTGFRRRRPDRCGRAFIVDRQVGRVHGAAPGQRGRVPVRRVRRHARCAVPINR